MPFSLTLVGNVPIRSVSPCFIPIIVAKVSMLGSRGEGACYFRSANLNNRE